METKPLSAERTGLMIGLLTSLALAAYFMAMKMLGLHMILELRFFNVIILSAAVYYGISDYKAKLNEQEFYLKGLGQGMYISVVAVVSFAIFMGFYLAYFDEPLMAHIRSTVSMGQYLDPLTIVFSIFLEGMASGAIITFAIMQYLKSAGTVGKKAIPDKS